MKNLFAVIVAAFVLVGCDRSNPVDSGSTTDVAYSEQSMVLMTQSTNLPAVALDSSGTCYDTTRHGRILVSPMCNSTV
jgi:uncharacterized protein YcfL